MNQGRQYFPATDPQGDMGNRDLFATDGTNLAKVDHRGVVVDAKRAVREQLCWARPCLRWLSNFPSIATTRGETSPGEARYVGRVWIVNSGRLL